MSKILIVDDDAMARRMAEFLLKKLGLTAVSAASGAEGMEKLRIESFAMTFLDVEMPGESGIDVLKAIRADAALCSAPVCFMTGTLTDELRREGEALAVSGYLSKPLAAPAVKALLAEHKIL
ncbi:MAG: response regulator [Oscillospiraceae bacterium]|nr:response regulator [Oscillospiraceae bacterium]